MDPVRLTIVSDSHLSPRTPEATENWDALVDHVERTRPHAVVHTGDLTLDGTTVSEELRYARAELDKMPATMLTLPGNHDLGDNPCETNADSPHLIDSERISIYREYVGEDRWVTDIGSWRLVGLNAQLLDSGLDEEGEQWDWLERQLSAEQIGDRHPAMFLHKPLLHSDPQPREHDEPIRYVRHRARERLLAMFEAVGARIVVSGHVHQHRRVHARNMEHVWAPTSWATIPEARQVTIGERWVGGLDITLADDGAVMVDRLRPPGLDQHVIGETIPDPYS